MRTTAIAGHAGNYIILGHHFIPLLVNQLLGLGYSVFTTFFLQGSLKFFYSNMIIHFYHRLTRFEIYRDIFHTFNAVEGFFNMGTAAITSHTLNMISMHHIMSGLVSLLLFFTMFFRYLVITPCILKCPAQF